MSTYMSMGSLGATDPATLAAQAAVAGAPSAGDADWLKATLGVVQSVTPQLVSTFGPKLQSYIPPSVGQALMPFLSPHQAVVVQHQPAPSAMGGVLPWAIGGVILLGLLGMRSRSR